MRTALAAGRSTLSDQSSVVWKETPRLDAEVLLRHVLGVDRAALLAHPERMLTGPEWRRYLGLLQRRQAGEPVAYLTGRREFMGHELRVDRRVLTPRPETELLVARALAHLPGNGSGWRVVDVGTGSGAIAVSLAAARPELRVVATDVSPEALAVARGNARRVLGPEWWRRVRFRAGNLLEPVGRPVDVIAANLPYVTSTEMDRLPVSVRQYEPSLALDGGADGLDLYRALLRQVPGKVRPGGILLMECDPRQAKVLAGIARKAFPDAQVVVRRDLAGRDRLVEVVV